MTGQALRLGLLHSSTITLQQECNKKCFACLIPSKGCYNLTETTPHRQNQSDPIETASKVQYRIRKNGIQLFRSSYQFQASKSTPSYQEQGQITSHLLKHHKKCHNSSQLVYQIRTSTSNVKSMEISTYTLRISAYQMLMSTKRFSFRVR